MAINSPNMVMGMYGDPTVFYGSQANRITSNREESEAVLSDAPVDGPLTRPNSMVPPGGNNITPKQVVNSPAGMTVLLLLPAYVLFHYAFGA